MSSKIDEARDAHWQLTRRHFCRAAMGTAAVLSASLMQACEPDVKPPDKDPFKLPQCAEAKSDDEKAIEAFCEVVIPGLRNDPKKIPGAVESCAVQLFFDKELPAAPLVPLIVLMLNSSGKAVGKKNFAELSYELQIKAVERSETQLAEFSFAIQLVRLAYYSSEVAAHYLKYPGANSGYASNPDFSFGKEPLAKEMTKDGNLP